MVQLSEAHGPQATLPPQASKETPKTPHCCGQEMQILLRRALLHTDGSVDFQTAWGCRFCGRRIL
jgi:hypothetical protein